MDRNFNFSEAIEFLKKGEMVKRKSWGDHFVFMQVPSTIRKEIVPNMQSLPQQVKDEFISRFDDPEEQIDCIYYCDQIAIVNRSNLISGYSPSVQDVMAEDWIIY